MMGGVEEQPPPGSIARKTLREVDPLGADDRIGLAARRVIEAGVPALPAVERDGGFAGIFGEREFMRALFPGYVGELASAAMISRSVDEAIERRADCAELPIRHWLNTDRVLAEEDTSDTHLAEIFIHHRVAIVPIATAGRVHGLVARSDFFAELVARFGTIAEDLAS
jgi:CBS domain-containing protein